MLWSKPTILYDTVLDYRTENHVAFVKYWKIKQAPTISAIRVGHKVCTVIMPPNINQTSILWQHLFLDPLLKDMQTGWHICLLPRHMVVVIKDGIYVCERLTPEKEEQIESTKTYLYRFGYEPDIPIQIHDFRQASETVTIPIHYKGFILEPYQPWYQLLKNIGLSFLKLFVPHTTSILLATFISLCMGCLYYGAQNYVHDFEKIRVLRSWPAIQSSKARLNQLFQLVGLFNEAKAPISLLQHISVNNDGITIQCSDTFSPGKNLEAMKQFLKKYYPHVANVSSAHSGSHEFMKIEIYPNAT